MSRNLILAVLLTVSLRAGDPVRSPVLVELFTSEGCSSCPPADRLLQQLDSKAIVLSEHVDYWNHLGWKDPFSSHAYTQRQEEYGRRLNTQGPYTPQIVVDGAAELLGSDGPKAVQAIAASTQRPKAVIRITRTSAGLDVEVTGAPHSANVFAALAENAAASQVSAGENQGRKLQHVAVLRSLRKIGSVKKGAGFHGNVDAPDGSARLIVFVQQADLGAIEGAAVWQQ